MNKTRDDRRQFAALVLASQLGVVSKQDIIAKVDQRILELDKPDYRAPVGRLQDSAFS